MNFVNRAYNSSSEITWRFGNTIHTFDVQMNYNKICDANIRINFIQ